MKNLLTAILDEISQENKDLEKEKDNFVYGDEYESWNADDISMVTTAITTSTVSTDCTTTTTSSTDSNLYGYDIHTDTVFTWTDCFNYTFEVASDNCQSKLYTASS